MTSRPSRKLETFPNPAPARDYLVHIEVPEFTCLCPLTGQPDFANLVIDYVPDKRNVELKALKLYMKYGQNKQPIIRGLRRISKSGLRRYVPATEIPRVVGGMGIAILSTSRGVMTDQEARQNKVGGEVLCYVW